MELQQKKIKSIRKVGKRKVYDLKVNHIHNFFLANGILSHNSGKDEALDFVSETDVLVKKKLKAIKRKIYDLSGTESPEVFLDYYKIDEKSHQVTNKIIKGILSENDLILARECSFLFRKSGQTSRQNKSEILLQALEGRKITSKLKSYGDKKEIDTLMKGIFMGVTRPVEEVKDSLLNSGLMQRCLFYVRRVDTSIREDMIDIASGHCFPEPKNNGNFTKNLEKLAQEIVDFVLFFKNTNFNLKNSKILNSIIATKVKSYNSDIEKSFKDDIQKQILMSFVGGFMNQSMMMSYINAAIRGDDTIIEEDLLSAFSVLEVNFRNLMSWIEKVVQLDDVSQRRVEKFSAIIRNAFKNTSVLSRVELKNEIQRVNNKTDQYCYNIIRDFTGTLVMESKKGFFRLKRSDE